MMKIGVVSSILEEYNFEQMIDIISEMGFQCVEAACWPGGLAERKYAGVSHIDVKRVMEDDEYANHILAYVKEKNIEISSLAFYPNNMDADREKRKNNNEHLMNVMRASAKLGIHMVTTFIGRDQSKSVDENLLMVKKIWTPITALAQKLKVKIGIENCPMLFDETQWPGGQNLMTTPDIWKRVFEILPSDYLGINYDPSHFVWQFMDYIQPIYDLGDKLFHVHFKDIKLYEDRLKKVGTMAYPLQYMAPKLPGLGDVRWDKFVSSLTDAGYKGYACVEVEDMAFESDSEEILNSLRLSKKYLSQYVLT